MNLKRIVEILPLFGILLTLLGYLKLFLYYDHWNINIIDYLDISEITLLFLSDVHIIVSFVAIFLFSITIGMAIVRYSEHRDEIKRKADQNLQIPNQAAQNIDQVASVVFGQFQWGLMIACAVIAAAFIILFFIYNKIALLYFATFGFVQFVLIFSELIFHRNEKATLQATFITSATAFSILVAHYDIRKTEINVNNFETTINLSETSIYSSPDLIYIGKTNNYLFLYNTSSKTSHAIKSDDLKEIIVKENS